MQERTFFEYEDVKVTSARFISGGQTYAMTNVTSIKPLEQKPKRLGGILVLVLGLLAIASNFIVGLLIVVAACIYLYMQKTVYHILLATSAGETKALMTYQREYLNQVVSALNDAIVYRG